MSDNTGPEKIVAAVGIFTGLDAEARATAIASMSAVNFPSGHPIFVQGEPGDCMYFVVSGYVKIGQAAPDGREGLLAVMGPSDMFGELAVFDPGPRTATATAVGNVGAMSMDRNALRAWHERRPDITEKLLQVVARRLRRTNDIYSDMIFVDAGGRIAKSLLALGQRFGTADTDSGILIDHQLTQSELAHLVGTARETLCKTLSDFERRGWIRVEGRSVVLTDPARLAQRAAAASNS